MDGESHIGPNSSLEYGGSVQSARRPRNKTEGLGNHQRDAFRAVEPDVGLGEGTEEFRD